MLHRRNGTVADTPSGNDSQPNSASASTPDYYPPSSSSTSTRDSDAPVLRRRDNSTADSDVTTQTRSDQQQTVTTSANTSTSTVADTNTSTNVQWGFSARDRRVINTCLADNPGSVPAKSPVAIPYHKGDTLPYTAQRQIRSLPLSCERQLVAVGNDLERVIYNQQVLLINSNSLVLDAFDVTPQQP